MARRRGEHLTLKTVASRLGVSTATISNAFNKPAELSQELREEILFACRQLKYAGPKAEARQRRAKKTRVVAVILSGTTYYGVDEPSLRSTLSGIASVFEHYDYNLLLVPSNQTLSNVSNIESFAEGFLICGNVEQGLVERLRQHKKTVIAINTFIENCVSINIDNQKAARRIARHAFEHSPKHVAVIGVELSEKLTTSNLQSAPAKQCASSLMVQRLNGLKDAAREKSINISDKNVWSIPKNTHFYGYETARFILNQAQKPDLILCMTDQIAYSTLDAIKELKISEKDAPLITGFEGIQIPAAHYPRITTVEVPTNAMGKLAAEIFLGLREEKNILLDTTLRIGETCA